MQAEALMVGRLKKTCTCVHMCAHVCVCVCVCVYLRVCTVLYVGGHVLRLHVQIEAYI